MFHQISNNQQPPAVKHKSLWDMVTSPPCLVTFPRCLSIKPLFSGVPGTFASLEFLALADIVNSKQKCVFTVKVNAYQFVHQSATLSATWQLFSRLASQLSYTNQLTRRMGFAAPSKYEWCVNFLTSFQAHSPSRTEDPCEGETYKVEFSLCYVFCVACLVIK